MTGQGRKSKQNPYNIKNFINNNNNSTKKTQVRWVFKLVLQNILKTGEDICDQHLVFKIFKKFMTSIHKRPKLIEIGQKHKHKKGSTNDS